MSDDLWWAMPVLAGRLIRLEPLALEHAPGYLAAVGAGEVFRWMSPPGGALAQPVTLEDATRHIAKTVLTDLTPKTPPGREGSGLRMIKLCQGDRRCRISR